MRRPYIHFLAVLSALLIVSGCNTPNHLIKSIKRKEIKLASKGHTIPKDTIYSSDTIISRIAIGDTVYITKTVTVTLEPIVEYKTRWQTKYEEKIKYKIVKVENKALVDSLKLELKRDKEHTKVTRIENRKSHWYIWLAVGWFLGSLTIILLKRFTNRSIF